MIHGHELFGYIVIWKQSLWRDFPPHVTLNLLCTVSGVGVPSEFCAGGRGSTWHWASPSQMTKGKAVLSVAGRVPPSAVSLLQVLFCFIAFATAILESIFHVPMVKSKRSACY